jgi:hypothetical protein
LLLRDANTLSNQPSRRRFLIGTILAASGLVLLAGDRICCLQLTRPSFGSDK